MQNTCSQHSEKGTEKGKCRNTKYKEEIEKWKVEKLRKYIVNNYEMYNIQTF